MTEVDFTTPPARRPLRLLSVVAPMFNEEGTADRFYARVVAALEGIPFELILVDDASSDRTPQLLAGFADRDPRVRVISLSRNFGHQAALTAGLEYARGDAVAMLDGDLQDPPELISEMLDQWREGSDVVYAVRNQRAGESWFKLSTARWFYRLFARLSDLELRGNSGDFRLLDRRALDALLSMRERNRFLRGMTVWVGYTQTAVGYDRDPRRAGETKYTLGKMLKFSFDAISSFSWVPLQAATLLGFVFSGVAFLGLPLVIVSHLAGMYVPGVSSILFVILLLGGIQLITVGIIGEYVGRIYDEVKGRPLYVVRDVRGGDALDAGGGAIDRAAREIKLAGSAAGSGGGAIAPRGSAIGQGGGATTPRGDAIDQGADANVGGGTAIDQGADANVGGGTAIEHAGDASEGKRDPKERGADALEARRLAEPRH